MTHKRITQERQDYLKAIYHLQQEDLPVRTTSIARVLGIEPASVTGVIQRLADLGLLDYQPYRGVTLTSEGERTALDIIRRHRLIELFLIESLGYSWDEVHDEAEGLEHVVSPLFIERLATILGHPEIDPHGSPIPTRDGQIEPEAGYPLSELPAGATGIVVRVDDKDPGLLRHLADIGIMPGTIIRVPSSAHNEEQLPIRLGDRLYTLALDAAQRVFVVQKNH
jgi:DtxR family Mn-dependent transcriptional regulator